MQVKMKDGFIVDAPDGSSKQDILALYNKQKPQQGLMKAPDYREVFKADEKPSLSNLYGFKRPIGLQARSNLQGLGGMMDFMGTPVRAAMQYAGMDDPAGGGKMLADKLNLPTPQGKLENIISGTGEIVAGGMGLMKGMDLASQMVKPGVTQNVLQAMAARPGLQLSSAVGAGGAGSTAKESGAGWAGQLAASILGGIGAPMSIAATQRTFSGGKAVIDKIMGDPKLNAKINLVLESAVKSNGGTFDDLSMSVRHQLQKDMKAAMKTGDMSPDVVRRLVDYRTTGLTPTAGPLTLDPGIVTKQKNLAAIGASSQDPKLQALSRIQNENNKKLISGLNDLGANRSGSNYDAGNKILAAIDERNAMETAKIDKLYKAARDTGGRSASLDPRSFTQKANDLLDEKMLGDILPSDVRTKINNIAKGDIPLTVDVAEQLKTNIGMLSRNSADKSVRMSLGLVRQALDDTPLLQGQNMGKESIKAFNAARKANQRWMSQVDDIPALKAVRDGIEPDKFTQLYIIGQGKGASINSVKKLINLLKDDPRALATVKDNVAQYLKSKALSMADDEVGAFSQSGFNRAMKAVGNEKLRALFGSDYNLLKAIGRVASYEQVQPSGSAVNNSKTAGAAIANILDAFGNNTILRRVPIAGTITANALKEQAGGMQAGAMTRLPLTVKPKQPMGMAAPLAVPALLTE